MRGNDKQEVFCGGLSSTPLQPFNSNQLYVYSCLKVLHIVNGSTIIQRKLTTPPKKKKKSDDPHVQALW